MRMDEAKERIKADVLKLHDLAERAVELCFKSIKGEEEAVEEISKIEDESDHLDVKVSDESSIFLLRFQPMARDFRFAITMPKIAYLYERIIDLAKEISLYGRIYHERIFEAEGPLMEMFKLVRDDLANIDRGTSSRKLEEEMTKLDDKLDMIYLQTLEIIEKDFKRPEEVLGVKHIERIGDLLAKIAIRLIYIKEGVWVRIK